MAEWPTEPTDIIREALREYVGDGDGADEAVLAAHDAGVKAEGWDKGCRAAEQIYGKVIPAPMNPYRTGKREAGGAGQDRPVQPTVQEDMTDAARAILALIGGRTEAEAVKGVQRWMALDLHMALGHGVEPPADAEQDWDDWWARMLAEVREHHTEAEVKAEALREAADEIARLIEIQSPDASITISVDTLIRALADRLDPTPTDASTPNTESEEAKRD